MKKKARASNIEIPSLTKQTKGIYLLIIKLKAKVLISAGVLPPITFRSGIYLYVGRAKNGLRGRLRRHLRKEKRPFWHIDSLLQKAKIEDVWIKPDFFRECQIARKIKNILKNSIFPLKGFGSSDCHCPSHLLFMSQNKLDLIALRKKIGFVRIDLYAI